MEGLFGEIGLSKPKIEETIKNAKLAKSLEEVILLAKKLTSDADDIKEVSFILSVL